jgi:hypothetical protein
MEEDMEEDDDEMDGEGMSEDDEDDPMESGESGEEDEFDSEHSGSSDEDDRVVHEVTLFHYLDFFTRERELLNWYISVNGHRQLQSHLPWRAGCLNPF